MLAETKWVDEYLVGKIQSYLSTTDLKVTVDSGIELPYQADVYSYTKKEPEKPKYYPYRTDLLIYEGDLDDTWIPLVVIECKLGGVNTHDVLTYGAKASTHKHIHPYLRYGMLIGALKKFPVKLFRHGGFFDFMVTWSDQEPDANEWKQFRTLMEDEISASRKMQQILKEKKTDFKVIHRKFETLL